MLFPVTCEYNSKIFRPFSKPHTVVLVCFPEVNHPCLARSLNAHMSAGDPPVKNMLKQITGFINCLELYVLTEVAFNVCTVLFLTLSLQ